MSENCGSCRFLALSKINVTVTSGEPQFVDGAFFECHRHAPPWSTTELDWFCGDFEPATPDQTSE